ncbi:MAG: hypothetical protein ABH832_03460 [bacterium]
MLKKFNLWGYKDKKIKNQLNPDLGHRDWNDLDESQKRKIWKYLNGSFSRLRMFEAIDCLNEFHKYNSYAMLYLENGDEQSAVSDFERIFIHEEQNVVLRLLSYYASVLSVSKKDKHYRPKMEEETEDEFIKRKSNWLYEYFDKFSNRLNDIFEHFGINVILTRAGFIPRQDDKITKDIYIPVLNFLSDDKWNDVSRELTDAFSDYRLKSKEGYSSCITHVVASLQAFLQILVNGKTGKGEINILIQQAQTKMLIPNDNFSNNIFKNIESTIMKERQVSGDPHPKKRYSNEQSCRFVLNLIMVFLQHSIQTLESTK